MSRVILASHVNVWLFQRKQPAERVALVLMRHSAQLQSLVSDEL